jgi:hypothetical protein
VLTIPSLISFSWIRLGLGTERKVGKTELGKKI